MEHHTHHRKMTKKIRNQSLDETGVRYIGDGSWGIPEPPCARSRITPNAINFDDIELNNPNHIWKITITNEAQSSTINYTAVDLSRRVVVRKVEILP